MAGRQHGVISAKQLAELGVARATVTNWTHAGRLHRLHRGVYAVGHEAITWEARCMGVVLANSPAVASHWTAAWLWGLLRSRPGTFHLTCSSRRHVKEAVEVHFGRLTREDLRRAEGITLTSVPRTLLDLASKYTPRQLDRLLDRAEERKLLDLRGVESLLERVPGHRGRLRLETALRLYRPTLATLRSDLERRFRDLLEAAGIPLPATNYVVGAYELDCFWEAERFAVELDVFATHGSPLAFEEDRVRADDLLLAGIALIRVTDIRLERDPAGVIARVAEHLRRRRRATAVSAGDLDRVE